MNIKRETRNARAAMQAFNRVRGKSYLVGDEADLADLLTALMVLAAAQPKRYGAFAGQLDRAQHNYTAEGGQ